ncbi:MAG TPA: hypothetical protein DCM49_00695 [Lachnospiraceae bacterium]|nr:hypothetical protein [Lachnospiraceae bacterium]
MSGHTVKERICMKAVFEMEMPKDCWSCRLAGRLCMVSMCVCRTNKGNDTKPDYCLLKRLGNGKAEFEIDEAQLRAGELTEHLEKMGAIRIK